MVDKNDYFRSLKQTLDNGYTTKEDLHDVLNFEPTKNRAAIDFRSHIAEGLIDRSEAMEFVGGL